MNLSDTWQPLRPMPCQQVTSASYVTPINKPVVLRIWSHVNGLKEAPLQNSISAIFAETWNRVKNKSIHTCDRFMKITLTKLKEFTIMFE
jgi:hypothetical protein